jgi:hypothetical protein
MATTTPNYGWTVPTSTDLVKDGATAIETLGDAIDASMNTALGTKKAGMVLLNTTSFSGVTSISLPANTFSSAYQNYVLKGILYCDSQVDIRLRAAGSDNSTASSYQTELHYGDANTSVGSYSTGTTGIIGVSRSGEKLSFNMDIFDINLAAKTYLQVQSVRPPTNMQVYNIGMIHTQTVAYDSMTFFSASGNFAAGSKISVYGVNQ